jgi:hypothetical protein
MRHIHSVLSGCIFLAVTLSCGNWLLPPLEVVSISTEGSIVITFSTQPSEESIKKAFSMTEDGQSVSGSFIFNDKTVQFILINGFRDNREYRITLTTTAEDKKGNSLLKDFEYQFFTKQDIEAPLILTISPENESDLTEPPEKISIAFSKPVDTVSFGRALSISPTVTYVLEWDSEYTIVDIIPIKPLTEGTRYTLTVSTTLTDTYRNALLTSFISTFLYGLDRNPPEISVVWKTPDGTSDSLAPDMVNQGIPSDSDLIIGFDKRVFIDAIAGFIEITPSISITVTPDLVKKNNALIKLNQKPEWGKNYTLKIKKGITDTSGNKTETELLYSLIFNAEEHRPVTFAGGILNNNSDYKYINSASDYSAITLDVTYFEPGGQVEKSTELYYAFRISTEADSLTLASSMQAISISTRNSCAYISIRTMRFLTPADTEYNTIYNLLNDNADGKLCILKIGIDIENADNRGFIIFSIRGDIKDTLGNTMDNSLTFTLNKQ